MILTETGFSMTKAVQKYSNKMGATGEGIKLASEIDMTKQNKLTDAWGTSTKLR